MQFRPHIQQRQVRSAEGSGGRGHRTAGVNVGQLGDGQRVEQLHVAQAAPARFEVGFGAVCDLAATLPAGLRVLDEFFEARGDSDAPLPARPAHQQRRQICVAGDVPRIEHGQAHRDVRTGDLQRLWDGAHTVVDTDVGVPQRIPEFLGDLADDLGRHVVVQQHQVQIGIRQHLPAAQTTGRDDREPTGRGDADLRRFCAEPEFVQIEQCVAQRRRVELARGPGQQLPDGRGQVGRGP